MMIQGPTVLLLAGLAAARNLIQTDEYRSSFLNDLLRPGYIENKDAFVTRSNPREISYGHGELKSFPTTKGEQQEIGGNKNITTSCGSAQTNTSSKVRVKRYTAQGSRWKVKNLSFKIINYPSTLSSKIADKEIRKAFKLWSGVAPFTFHEESSGPAHIEIKFVTGEHGDHKAFDENNQEIAHAFYPYTGGDIHFDDNIQWTSDSDEGYNLFQVMTHELGHSLGLDHSEVEEAVMYQAESFPYYNPNFRLHQDDIDAIQSLYGSNVGSNDFSETGDSLVAELCNDARIDTIFYSPEREIYVFKGKYYWKLSRKGSLISGPNPISSTWPGLPGHIDAAFTVTASKKTYFFKKNLFWRYDGFQRDKYYPKLIGDGFPGIPDDLDAAMYNRKSESIIFFKGSKFWKFNPRSRPPVLRNYPRSISSTFHGDVYIPNPVDGVISTHQSIYFFKNTEYYRFAMSTFTVEPPKPSYEWFGCEPQGLNIAPGSKLQNYTAVTKNISWKSGEGYS